MSRKSSRWDNDEELQARKKAFEEMAAAKPKSFDAATPEAILARQMAQAQMTDLQQPEVSMPTSDAAPVAFENTLPVGDIGHRVPLSLIDPNPQNSRAGYTENEIEDMREYLNQANRQLSPISLESYTKDGEPRFYCIDGWTRVQAMRLEGWKEAQATFTGPLTPLERHKRSIIANDATRHTTDYDHGVTWDRMINEEKLSRQDILDTFGDRKISPAKLSQVLSITKLPQSIIDLIGANKYVIGYTKYYRLYQIYEQYKRYYDSVRAEEEVYELTQRAAASPDSVPLDMLVALSESVPNSISENSSSDDSLSASNQPTAGSQTLIPQLASREFNLSRGGIDVGKIVRPEKGGLRLTIDKRLPSNVVDEIQEAIQKIIEGHQQ